MPLGRTAAAAAKAAAAKAAAAKGRARAGRARGAGRPAQQAAGRPKPKARGGQRGSAAAGAVPPKAAARPRGGGGAGGAAGAAAAPRSAKAAPKSASRAALATPASAARGGARGASRGPGGGAKAPVKGAASAAQGATEVPAFFGGFVRGRELGRGAFAVVYACERKSDGARFAAKAVDLRQLRLFVDVAREVKKLRREASVLQKLPPHNNLVKFVDVIQEGHWLFFLLELVNGGNLFQALVGRPGKRPKLSEAEVRHVFRQLVDGLNVLHSKAIVHRDLKLENVLVVREHEVGQDRMLDVKIADFGLSKVVGEGVSEARSTVGSPRYMAPEVIAKGSHDFRADLWSLGVLAHVLLDGRFPCDGASAKVRQEKLNEAVAKLPVSKNAQDAVLGLLQLEPSSRLTIQQLCSHPWLTGCGRTSVDKRLVTEREGGGSGGAQAGGKSADNGAKRPRMSSPDPPGRCKLFGQADEAALDSAFSSFRGVGKPMLDFSPGK